MKNQQETLKLLTELTAGEEPFLLDFFFDCFSSPEIKSSKAMKFIACDKSFGIALNVQFWYTFND